MPDAGDCELAIGTSWQRDTDGIRARRVAAALQCGLSSGLEAQAELEQERSVDGLARAALIGAEARWLASAPGAPRPWLGTLFAGLAFETAPGRGWRALEATLELTVAAELWPGGWLDLALAAQRERSPSRWRSPWALGLEHETAQAGAWRLELAGTGGERPQLLLEWAAPLADDLELVLQAGATPGRPRAREFGMALKLEF